MKEQKSNGIFILIELTDNIIHPVGLELIGKGKELAEQLNTTVTAVLPGHNLKESISILEEYGADQIITIDDPALETYMTEPYAHALTEVVMAYNPEIVLIGATAIGRDVAPRLSARLHTGLTADCTTLEIQEESNYLMMTRPAFGGNIMATILCPDHRPQMATVRPGVMQRMKREPGRTCPIIEFTVDDLADHKNVTVMEIIKKTSEKINITDADVLIAGGRGIGDAESFHMLQALADELGGSVCASRAAVEASWQPKEVQVGQTGSTVRPGLYIACGISGAIQHLAGMENSDVIIAINTDPTAPIFDVANYGVVGDAKKIIPLFIEEIRKMKAGKLV